ncbi:MAG: NADH-ubiquinone oxidoreductase-F iron-sulfur binding region domain-containing protein [Actinomycetota bacterium]|nr:NADH-ubiquinone oxidoreductase-F iron-sulfur binding region domain-containing protein [Actinomycetota bacterium]
MAINIEEKKNKINSCKKRVNLIFKDQDVLQILDKISGMDADKIINEIKESGLRGRGGAGFPTWIKWKGAKEAQSDIKYIVCNADEGEPGTFKDREILAKKPEKVFAGMTAAAKAANAKKGYIYLRDEYNYMLADLIKKTESFNDILKQKSFDFSIEIKSGSGAYVCGEETSLLESMEGKRGEARNKPPFPAQFGYLGKPTVINNAETLVYAALIILDGADSFKKLGTADSRGAKVFSVSGDTEIPGIYEVEMGMSLKEFVDLFGDENTKAVQVGGASGFCVPRSKFNDTIIGFEGIPTGGSMMLFSDKRSMYNVLSNYLEFFTEESCGQCTPCRVGCKQLLEGIRAIKKGEKPKKYIEELIKLAKNMKITAKCGLGQSVENPFVSIVENFTEEITY